MKVRDKLLSTASGLFHRQGYNATGINQIIDEAGIAKGSFYYHFKSKEELCMAFLNARHEYWLDRLKQFVGYDQTKQSVVLAFDFLLKMNEEEHFRGCSFLNILSEIDDSQPEVLKIIQNHKSNLREYLLTLLEKPELAHHVYLIFEGALIESQLFKNQWPVMEGRKIVESLISE